MTTTATRAADIVQVLAHCTGTEHWYRHPLNRSCLYTDGAKTFATMAGAYWFLDIMATEVVTRQHEHEFIAVTLAVADSKATITADDGNGNVFWTRAIEFTDCPQGDWKFYVMNKTVLVPSEY